ncbi:hypothetical protein C0995_008697 [Termitomyces sp. Mi166|nr:hypothetical protein C0995_008697 [Termitomyces sp. Mi166\
MFSTLRIWVLYFAIGVARAALPACPDSANADYDYIVVGAGAGGGPLASRLVEAGYSVLVIDAGHDTVNYNTTIPGYFTRSLEEYPAGFPVTRNDQCRIEDNLYLWPQSQILYPDHGFKGWLKTSLLPLDVFVANPSFLDPQLASLIVAQWNPLVAGPPILDLNTRSADSAFGVGPISFTIDEQHIRTSVRGRLAAVQQSNPGKLSLSLDTLATKILLCNSGSDVTAYGVQIAPGAALPVAANFNGKVQNLNITNVTARHEVIISADHDEVTVNWLLKDNFTMFDGCRFLSDPTADSCLQYWLDHEHKNGYAFAPATNGIITKSSSSLPAPDVLTYWIPAFFRGFFRGVPQEVASIPNGLTAVVLKAHPSSKGTVKLTGSHPQDPLDIQKLHFQASGGPADVAAIREGIKRARQLVALPPISPYVKEEIAPGPTVTTDDQIDNFIYNRVFGHHACCTNPIGPDNDPNAVLDGNFKVRGVKNLRVVDLSSWSNVPGFFPTTLTYMISEKAADVIIAAARSA